MVNKYSRASIEYILLHYPEFALSRKCSEQLSWALFSADLLSALKSLPIRYRRLFYLYIIRDLSINRCCELLNWSPRSLNSRWNELVRLVTARLTDSREYPQPWTGKGPLPLGRADYRVGENDPLG